MSSRNSSSTPRGKPESLKRNPKLIKFSKLMMNAESLAPALQGPPIVTSLSQSNALEPSPKPTPRKRQPLSSDPVKVLKKSSSPNLASKSALKPSREGSNLGQAIRSFDKKYTNTMVKETAPTVVKIRSATSSNAGTITPVTTIATAAVATTTSNEARGTNSAYISAQEDFDEDYVEMSDASGSMSEDCIVNILYEDTAHKKPKSNRKGTSNSNPSNDSIMESGYKSFNSITTGPRFSQESNPQISEAGMAALNRCRLDLSPSSPQRPATNSVKSCMSDVYPVCRPNRPSTSHFPMRDSEFVPSAIDVGDSSEQMSDLIVDLIGPNSRIGKLILQSCACAGRDTDAIYDDIKQCVQAELQMENKLTSFFKKHRETASTSFAPGQYESLRNLDDSLTFVKDHLTDIRSDLNEFKENCWRKIDFKVSHTEFSDTTSVLKTKMTYLEKKLFNEVRVMRQNIGDLREKINNFENEAACSGKNFSIWPYIVCFGAYSILKLRKR